MEKQEKREKMEKEMEKEKEKEMEIEIEKTECFGPASSVPRGTRRE